MNITYDGDTATVTGASNEDEAYAVLSNALQCEDSGAALDQINATTWWAYCEPALAPVGIGDASYVEGGYPPHVTPTAPPPECEAWTASGTCVPDLPPVLIDTGSDPTALLLFAGIGIILVVAGIAIFMKGRTK